MTDGTSIASTASTARRPAPEGCGDPGAGGAGVGGMVGNARHTPILSLLGDMVPFRRHASLFLPHRCWGFGGRNCPLEGVINTVPAPKNSGDICVAKL